MNIGIVGLGLIGGSLGLDLRSQGYHVLGVSRQVTTCEQAIARGIVDAASTDGQLLETANLVFLCTPLGVMETTAKAIIPHLSPETTLTDVGSVKAWVVNTLAPLWPNFVGGHPMAGTADSGIAAAQSGLFQDAPYVLTPTATTPKSALEQVEKVVRGLQVRLYHCSPEEHDLAVAWISHLPVMVSASLIAACVQEANLEVQFLAKALASSGFRDTSRVGGGNPELGLMMAQYNQDSLLRSLYTYRQQLDHIIGAIAQSDWATLQALLQQTHQMRSAFTTTIH